MSYLDAIDKFFIGFLILMALFPAGILTCVLTGKIETRPRCVEIKTENIYLNPGTP